jgi:hypothetical protein
MRAFKTVGIVLGIYIVAFLVDFVMVSGSPDYQGGVTVLVILSFLAFLAPKVGYRWFDCFLTAIPFYGIYFIFRIAHRIAFLPERDWSERSTI